MYSVNFPNEGKSDIFGLDVCQIGSGATGTVYAFEAFGRKYAAKIIENISDQTRDKIKTMISMSSVLRKKNEVLFDQLAWPVGEIYKEGQMIGFSMPVLSAEQFIPFESFFDYNLRDRLPSSDFTSISLLSELVAKLAELLAFLHSEDIYVIDLKPQNIRVAKKDLSVFLLDCDSFSFKSPNGKAFPAGFVSADYICPETIRNKLSPSDLGEGQDRYAFSVLAFQMFNKGIHPFQGVLSDASIDAPTNDQKAELGLYTYGSMSHSQLAAHPRSVHKSWPSSLRSLFNLAFTTEDMVRPSLANWCHYFIALVADKKFQRCTEFPADPKHIHFSEGECVECFLDKLKNTGGWKPAVDKPPIPGAPTPNTAAPPAQPPITPKRDKSIWYILAAIALMIIFSRLDSSIPSEKSRQPTSISASSVSSNTNGKSGSIVQPKPVTPEISRPLSSDEVTLTRSEMLRLRLAIYRQLPSEKMPENNPQITSQVSSLPALELRYLRTLAARFNIGLVSGRPNRAVVNKLLELPNRPRSLSQPVASGDRQEFFQWSSYRSISDDRCYVSTTATSVSSPFVAFVPEIRGSASTREKNTRMTWELTYPMPFHSAHPIYAFVDGARYQLEIVNGALRPARAADGPSLDASVIRAMRAGNFMTISGANKLTDEEIVVQFSLRGMTRAFNDMILRCNRNDLRVWIYNN